MQVPVVYKDTPQFGFDIGNRTIKVVQLRRSGDKTIVQGYGYAYFPDGAIVEGIIVDPGAIATAIKPLLHKLTYGKITSKRVVTGLPTAKLFTRTLQLPPMSDDELSQAIGYEVEQYVPVPLSDLYIDYEIINHKPDKEGKIDVLMVAAPRAIVDSYLQLFDKLGLQISAIESNMTAVVRALLHSGDASASSLVMDIGSKTTDITVYQKYIPLTASVAVGGETYTQSMVKVLGIKRDQANEIKVKFGIGPSDMRPKILSALSPHLEATVKEVKRVVKYYEERGGRKEKVESMVISGGSAAAPGINEYFEQQVGLPLKVADPWRNINTKKTHLDSQREAPLYATAIGLALRGLL